MKQFHKYKESSENLFDFTTLTSEQTSGGLEEEVLAQCGSTYGCYMSPDNCASDECDYIVAYAPGDGYTDFIMAAKRDYSLGDDQYVAIGFSPDGGMVWGLELYY